MHKAYFRGIISNLHCSATRQNKQCPPLLHALIKSTFSSLDGADLPNKTTHSSKTAGNGMCVPGTDAGRWRDCKKMGGNSRNTLCLLPQTLYFTHLSQSSGTAPECLKNSHHQGLLASTRQAVNTPESLHWQGRKRAPTGKRRSPCSNHVSKAWR